MSFCLFYNGIGENMNERAARLMAAIDNQALALGARAGDVFEVFINWADFDALAENRIIDPNGLLLLDIKLGKPEWKLRANHTTQEGFPQVVLAYRRPADSQNGR